MGNQDTERLTPEAGVEFQGGRALCKAAVWSYKNNAEVSTILWRLRLIRSIATLEYLQEATFLCQRSKKAETRWVFVRVPASRAQGFFEKKPLSALLANQSVVPSAPVDSRLTSMHWPCSPLRNLESHDGQLDIFCMG
ncbi:unnamed protein product [Durusdinium trenchii]|uniref:Uncharacterized protein n=1 Tax=Durusdinium trenchii TaxID=1381693 RepID=A0ABP0MDI1_9DINO